MKLSQKYPLIAPCRCSAESARHHRYPAVALLVVGLMTTLFAQAQDVSPSEKPPVALGDALLADVGNLEQPPSKQQAQEATESEPLSQALASGTPTSGFTIDRTDRNSVASAYHAYFTPSEGYAAVHGYTGNVQNRVPGTVSTEFQEMTLLRVNYYRAQAGLPADIVFTATKSAKAQKAALIMAHLNTLTHYPLTEYPGNAAVQADVASGSGGIEAAANSNLSLGTFGPRSIDGQMTDSESGNTIVGHRRWILYSRAKEMGNGATPPNGTYPYSLPEHPAIGCLWVFGNHKPAPAAQAVAWPNAGYVPWDLAPNNGETHPRWSYSYPGANFTGATVTMKRGTTNISVVKEPVTNGAGDNTLVWRPSGIPDSAPASDTTYTVTITGITGAPFTTATYNVILIDPYSLNGLPVVSGSATPFRGVANGYNFTSVSQAEAYEARITKVGSGTWLEGAEPSPSPSPKVIDNTDASYALISSAYSATGGTRAFHLATPDFGEDSFTIDRNIYPQSGGQVVFKSRRLFMHPDTKLHVELSGDEGASFAPIYTLPGQNSTGSSGAFDSSFTTRTVSIPSNYLNQSVRLRFRISVEGNAYINSGDNYGLYIDDISTTNCLELTAPSAIALAGGASSFSFTPDATGQAYLLQVRPRLGGHWFGYGNALAVSSVALPAPVINSAGSVTGAQGAAFSYTVTALNNPASFGASGLPPGASIHATTGVITGTIAPGTYTTTIRATNATGTGTASLSIVIRTGYQNAVANTYPGLGSPLEDDDMDGIANIVELSVSGMNPTVPDAQLAPKATASGGNLVMTVSKSGLRGVGYAIEGSGNLATGSWGGAGITIVTNNASTLSVRYPLGSSTRYFLHLAVTQNSETTAAP